MATTSEAMRDDAIAERNERYDVQLVITQQLPHQPLPGERLVNTLNKFSAFINDQKSASQSFQEEEEEEEEEETSDQNEVDEETSKRHEDLYVAALEGDWRKADGILKYHRNDVRAKLSDLGDTVLHVAVTAGRKDFVKELVNKYLTKDDLERKNDEKNTAFSIAAMLGDTKLAELLFKRNEGLAMIYNGDGMLPVVVAAKLDHEKMVRYLYPATKDNLTENDRIELLVTLINNDSYDIALSMVKEKEFKTLAISRVKVDQNENGNNEEIFGETALHALARKPVIFYDFDKSMQGILKRYYQQVDEENHSIFHTAVLYRHENIFKLIYGRPSIKNVVVTSAVGNEGNNILHLAAKSPPDHRLKIVPGAALQMQREMWWFKEVSELMPRFHAGAENSNGKTARSLFTESHKDLMKEGEEWMKKTAESCMLIATVVFAAAFTVPGGVKGDTGAPNFLKKAIFKIFAVSDTVSLVSSSCSILTFLSILTSRYTEEDFLWSLPAKLLLGLSTLFMSIIGMMAVFGTTLFIVFQEGTIWPAALAVGLASIPITMFILQHTHLLFDVVRLMSSSNSLFQENRSSFKGKQLKKKL